MKISKSWLAVLAAVAALTSAQTVSAGSAQSRYTVTDLGTLPGLGNSYVWGGVNSQGHVGVYAIDSTDPNAFAGASSFLWKGPGDIQLLPGLPGATTTVAFGLNDLDQVVGGTGPTATAQAPQGQYVAVLWESGNPTALGTLPGDTDSDAMAINNSGLVAGHSLNYNVDPYIATAVYWSKGKIAALPLLDGTMNSDVLAVNDRGEIVGLCWGSVGGGRAVVWSTFPKDSVKALATLGGDDSWAGGINNNGQIVGAAQTVSGHLHPVLWNETEIIDLQNFGNDSAGAAYWINSYGQIVGYSGPDKSGSDLHNTHALLWENGQVINLQTQIPGNSGWVLRSATGINDRGQITGSGQHNGKNRAFLLTPVDPQPLAAVLLGGNAMAAKKPQPPVSLFWTNGAKLVVNYYPGGMAPSVAVAWPIASDADHYRLTVIQKSVHESRALIDWSPAGYTITSDGWAYRRFMCIFSSLHGATTGLISVTAYSGPDEAMAYSESLRAEINVR